MSSSKDEKNSLYRSLDQDRENDPYALIERAADILWERSKTAINNQQASRISDEAVAKIMTAAIKLYAAKSDGEFRTFRPVLGNYDEVVTPTEALTSVTEVLRALGLGPMEFGLWSRRRPEDYHEKDFKGNEFDREPKSDS